MWCDLMSLLISLIPKDNNFDAEELEKYIPEPYNNLFGFEGYRQSVWGNEIIKEIGCDLIYSLKDGDIYAFDEKLQELKNELKVIVSNIEFLKSKEIGDDFIGFRVNNALEAIRVAEQYKDIGVWIG